MPDIHVRLLYSIQYHHLSSFPPALLGALGCFVLMFVIHALYAAITLGMFCWHIISSFPFHTLSLLGRISAVMVMLFIYLLLRAPATPWGDVSQALIYHQVRNTLALILTSLVVTSLCRYASFCYVWISGRTTSSSGAPRFLSLLLIHVLLTK